MSKKAKSWFVSGILSFVASIANCALLVTMVIDSMTDVMTDVQIFFAIFYTISFVFWFIATIDNFYMAIKYK